MKAIYRYVLIVLGAAALLLTAAVLFFWGLVPYRYHGAVLESARPAADFTLTGPAGKTVRLSDFRGKVVVLYFGYTFCPDVCPTTMAELGQAMRQLGRRADEIQVLMITVDPERDTVEALASYLAHFDPRFIGLTGTAEQIASAATPFGIFYQKHEGSAASGYLVDHTATTTVLDRQGRIKLLWPYGTEANALAADLNQLLK
jgi:protein SCO1/2